MQNILGIEIKGMEDMNNELNQAIEPCLAAYRPLLQKLSQSVKVEMYSAIYADAKNMPEEVISLGVALTADPDIQDYLNRYMRSNATPTP
jgi:hypothetical protein